MLYREILSKFGQGLLTVHEQLTVSRYFGDYKVNITNNTQERWYDTGLGRLSKPLLTLFEYTDSRKNRKLHASEA